jgi:guanine deaminase
VNGYGGLTLRGPVLSPLGLDRAVEYEDGFVMIRRDGRIGEVGPWPPDRSNLESPEIGTGRALVLPAFIDAHVHLPQIEVRGRYGLSLLDWLETHVYPAEAKFEDADHAARVAEHFFSELASSGTGTAAVFTTVHAEATERAFEAAAASGLRIVMGKVLMDRGAPARLLESPDVGVRSSLDLAERWEGAAGERLHYAITPRFALTSTPKLLEGAGRAARDTGLRIQTHLAEQPEEVAEVHRSFPGATDYLEVYERAGLLGPRSIFAHAIHCSGEAFARLASAHAAIACCPTSNAFLHSGSFPLERARASGATIAIGSDVGAGPQFHALDVLRHFSYLDSVPPRELLYRATLAGAEALDLADVTGSLQPGRAADIVVLEPPADVSGPPLDVFAQCVFRQPETRIRATLVEGIPVHGELAR